MCEDPTSLEYVRCVLRGALFKWVEGSILSIGIIVLRFTYCSVPPSLLSPFPTDFISVTSTCFSPLLHRGSWLDHRDLTAMGAVSIKELAANSESSWMSSINQPPHCHSVITSLYTILQYYQYILLYQCYYHYYHYHHCTFSIQRIIHGHIQYSMEFLFESST